MLGFMIKDLLIVKHNAKLLALMAAAYLVMGLVSGDTDLSFLLPFMTVMLMMTTFNYDNYNKWEAYAAALPSGRKGSVRAKYLATILLAVISSLVSAALTAVIMIVKLGAIDFAEIGVELFGAIIATLLLLGLMYPAIYQFGIEKARIGVLMIVLGIAIVGGVASQFVDYAAVMNALAVLGDYLLPLLTAGIAGLVLVSYLISARVAGRKEF